jgi:hypothetical protein
MKTKTGTTMRNDGMTILTATILGRGWNDGGGVTEGGSGETSSSSPSTRTGLVESDYSGLLVV